MEGIIDSRCIVMTFIAGQPDNIWGRVNTTVQGHEAIGMAVDTAVKSSLDFRFVQKHGILWHNVEGVQFCTFGRAYKIGETEPLTFKLKSGRRELTQTFDIPFLVVGNDLLVSLRT